MRSAEEEIEMTQGEVQDVLRKLNALISIEQAENNATQHELSPGSKQLMHSVEEESQIIDQIQLIANELRDAMNQDNSINRGAKGKVTAQAFASKTSRAAVSTNYSTQRSKSPNTAQKKAFARAVNLIPNAQSEGQQQGVATPNSQRSRALYSVQKQQSLLSSKSREIVQRLERDKQYVPIQDRVGDIMKDREIKRNELRLRENQREKEEQQASCSFRPQTNSNSYNNNTNNPHANSNSGTKPDNRRSFEQFIESQSQWQQRRQQKQNQIVAQQQEKIKEQHTHHPQISEKSLALSQKNKSYTQSLDVVERLYSKKQQFEEKQKRLQEQELKDLFKPTVSENSKKICGELAKGTLGKDVNSIKFSTLEKRFSQKVQGLTAQINDIKNSFMQKLSSHQTSHQEQGQQEPIRLETSTSLPVATAAPKKQGGGGGSTVRGAVSGTATKHRSTKSVHTLTSTPRAITAARTNKEPKEMPPQGNIRTQAADEQHSQHSSRRPSSQTVPLERSSSNSPQRSKQQSSFSTRQQKTNEIQDTSPNLYYILQILQNRKQRQTSNI